MYTNITNNSLWRKEIPEKMEDPTVKGHIWDETDLLLNNLILVVNYLDVHVCSFAHY
jgi:hypothetical protein